LIDVPIIGLAYNAANQLTQFGTSQLTSDDDGNLTSDGAYTYTWDAHNPLIAIDGRTRLASSTILSAAGSRRLSTGSQQDICTTVAT
jgi:hypothetical protein